MLSLGADSVGCKKDNDELRTRRHMDSLRWEAAKTLGLEKGPGDDLAESTSAGRDGGVRADRDTTISNLEKAVMKEGKRIAEANLRDERERKEKEQKEDSP